MNTKEFYDEMINLIKAIGTSSSIDQERDERSVENYVRQTGNVNTPPVNVGDYTIGGNNMSNNTTEPDPKGDVAVQKDLPIANQPAATDLVNQETRPVGDVSVSDAPNVDANADVSTGGAGVYKAGMTCPDCHQAIEHKCAADSAKDDESKVEKAAAEDEVTESPADDETVEKSVDSPAETIQKSVGSPIWKGAFAPLK
jgi:hypothetical protein